MRSQEVLRKLEIPSICLNGLDVRIQSQLLGDNADGVGVLNTNPEIHGVVRRVPNQCVSAKIRIPF